MTLQELNAKLEIKKVKDLKIEGNDKYILLNGHVLFIEGKGYVCFPDSYLKEIDSHVPYQPQGGYRALKEIIENGGLVHYDDIKFIG